MCNKFLKLSLITFITGALFLILAFFAFHYLTDAGISTVWQQEANKPYITELLGDFGIINISASFISLVIHFVFNKKEK